MAANRSTLLLTGIVLCACEFPAFTVGETKANAGGSAGNGGSAPTDLNVPNMNGGAMPAPDPCDARPCQNDGRCVATLAGSFVCVCKPGFRGDQCELTFDNCEPDPCKNGGACSNTADAASCQCPSGWEGPTCEHDHDDCADEPCQNGGICSDGFQTRTCSCTPGFAGKDCEAGLLPTCRAIADVNPAAVDGSYVVDPDGPGQGNSPLDVYCDMDNDAWMLVAQEHAGVSGTLKYLGVSVGDPSAAARESGNAMLGEHFRGLYEEVWVTWSKSDDPGDGIFFRVNEEMFTNTVRTAMPVKDFWSTNTMLLDWVNAAGGAVLCRASQSPDVRPGDSSWGIKPQDDTNALCGCSSHGWTGRGAFYGGHSDPTSCNPSGGGWAGITDNGGAKGNVNPWWLQIWVR